MTKEIDEGSIPEDIEVDVVVRMPPLREWTVTAKVESIDKGVP
ncbi:MAG: hypothetical protein WBA22_15525 [Candidatus Methanofastidiosia archaeon]